MDSLPIELVIHISTVLKDAKVLSKFLQASPRLYRYSLSYKQDLKKRMLKSIITTLIYQGRGKYCNEDFTEAVMPMESFVMHYCTIKLSNIYIKYLSKAIVAADNLLCTKIETNDPRLQKIQHNMLPNGTTCYNKNKKTLLVELNFSIKEDTGLITGPLLKVWKHNDTTDYVYYDEAGNETQVYGTINGKLIEDWLFEDKTLSSNSQSIS